MHYPNFFSPKIEEIIETADLAIFIVLRQLPEIKKFKSFLDLKSKTLQSKNVEYLIKWISYNFLVEFHNKLMSMSVTVLKQKQSKNHPNSCQRAVILS